MANEKKNAEFWIEFNPATGNIKPWEVWWQAEGFGKMIFHSCATEAAAKKSLQEIIKNSEPYYNVTAR